MASIGDNAVAGLRQETGRGSMSGQGACLMACSTELVPRIAGESVAGAGQVQHQDPACMAWAATVADELRGQTSPMNRPLNRARGMLSDHDCAGAVDGRDVSQVEARKQWSWENTLVEVVPRVPRMETIWSGMGCPISRSSLQRMRMRVQAIVQGTSMPGEPGVGSRGIAAAVKRTKAAGLASAAKVQALRLPQKRGKESFDANCTATAAKRSKRTKTVTSATD